MAFGPFSPETKKLTSTSVTTQTSSQDLGFGSTGAFAPNITFGRIGNVGAKSGKGGKAGGGSGGASAFSFDFQNTVNQHSEETTLAPTVNVASGEGSTATATPTVGGGGLKLDFKTIAGFAILGLIAWLIAKKV